MESFSEDSVEKFSYWFNSPDHRVFAGLFGDAIVAYGILEFSNTNDNQRIASIKEIFVLKDARSVGVGESLISFMTQEATVHNVVGIDSFALPGDRETKNFFETQGMVARLIHVYRTLESN
ncbi:MAG: GNAT family N-acetyltransferase [Acidimicrobiales bacterium]|nr:GNAT family N-acetyltransferase [Acidimicrobiales bacterium]